MPTWGILKNSKKKAGKAHKVHFSKNREDQPPDLTEQRSRSSSLDSQLSDQRLKPLPPPPSPPQLSASQLDLSHEDVVDEEERECLRHLDQLGLALENTFKDVESIDSYVRKLRLDFDQEMVPEKRFMSCMCSAKLARAACCKKQIEVWQQLQHEMQEMCCHHHHCHHHHPHLLDMSHHHHSDNSLTESHASDSDTSSICTVSSQDLADRDFLLLQLDKMVLFDVVRQRLDPSADPKTFVEHWILNVQTVSYEGGSSSHGEDSHAIDVRF